MVILPRYYLDFVKDMVTWWVHFEEWKDERKQLNGHADFKLNSEEEFVVKIGDFEKKYKGPIKVHLKFSIRSL